DFHVTGVQTCALPISNLPGSVNGTADEGVGSGPRVVNSRTRIPGTRPVERLLVPGIDHVRLGTILHKVPVIGTNIDPARLLDECSRALPDRPLKCSSRTGVVSDLDRSLPRHVSVNSVEDFI